MKKFLVRVFATAAVLPCLMSSALAAGNAAYTDVVENSWYAEAVQELSETQILPGISSDLYGPGTIISKNDFATALWKLANGSTEADAEAVANWAFSMELFPEGSDLSQGFSRQDAALALQNFILNAVVNIPATLNIPREFEDQSQISAAAVSAVQMMQNTSLMSGFPDGSFRPANMLTRAEAATILHKLAPSCENLPLVISLPGNPSTGYSWNLEKYDEETIRVDVLGYEAQPEGEGLLGAPSDFRLAVYGLKEGRATLDIYYTRAGEKIEDAADETHITLAVDAEGKVVQLSR
ncbi:MAG: S-layer homology domain-containing protein [Bacillota bacterium]|nr:S-layer homology domain-containing protein [Bacillota bacterium]